MTPEERIAELKKQLKKYSKKDEARLKVVKDRQEIVSLKKQIRAKKYAGVVQTGKNLKTIGKNIVVVTKSIGKGMEKFIGEEPKKKDGSPKYDVNELLKKLPQ